MTDEEATLDPTDVSDRDESIDVVESAFTGGLDHIENPSDGSVDFDESEIGIEEVTKERDEYLDSLRRLQADFENFRKRTIRQQSEMLDRSSSSLLERLLPVLDALDYALAHDQGDESKQSDISAALVQIAQLANATLEKEGLERIDERGVKFDPTIHDAVSRVEAEDVPDHEPTVAEVMRAGYRLKGKVIRPAMVAVKG